MLAVVVALTAQATVVVAVVPVATPDACEELLERQDRGRRAA